MTDPEEYVDFTHKNYVPTRTPKGIPYDPFMTPQKAGSLLVKVATKSKHGHKPTRTKAASKGVAKPARAGAAVRR